MATKKEKTFLSRFKIFKWWRGHRWLRILVLGGVICFLLGCIALIGAFAYFSRDLPNPDRIMERKVVESTKIYDRTGETLLYDIHGQEQRTIINLEEIPEYVKQTTIVLEDKDFYRHKGFSLTDILRAGWVNITRGGKVQGGSTITQQFIKNSILTSEKKYTRKIKEIILAYQLERKFNKDQILKLYLNEIPYGSTAYGIEAAANIYFGKKAKDLNLAEAAVLASLPKAPSYYSPWTHLDRLKARQEHCLDLMVEQNYLTKDQAGAAKAEKLNFREKRENIIAPHFVMYVKELLEEKYGTKTVETGGLKVITTLDLNKQRIAEEAIVNGVTKNESKYRATNAALISLDPKTGEILAMVGSKDYFDTEHDGNVNVTLSPRQPGSSFKPVVYATAFSKGYTPQTMLFDLVTVFPTEGQPYIPHNYDLGARGPISMKRALAGSLNIPAVETLYLAGIDKVLDQAEKMGYTTFKDRQRFGLALVLGGAEVKLLDHASAFTVFAREGLKHDVSPILRIEDVTGKVVEQHDPHEERVLDEQVARQINDILSDNNARAYIFGGISYLTVKGRPVAVKTGTTNDYRDAWTLGYTPSIVTGVWAGNNDNSEMVRGADGSVVAAPIWNEYMSKVLEGTPVEEFREPDPVKANKPILAGEIDTMIKKKVDKITGKLIPDDCKDYPKEFIEERELRETHTILYYVNKDDPQGSAPENPEADPMYKTWEDAVQNWAKENGYWTKDYEVEDCHFRDKEKQPFVQILFPSSGGTISSKTFTIKVQVSGERAIKRVEYYLNNKLIGQATNSPFNFEYTTNLANGIYSLKAIVYDEVDNHSSNEINFNLLVDQQSAIAQVTRPVNGQSFTVADFPLTLTAQALDPEGVAQVSFYYYNLETLSSNHQLISTLTSVKETAVANWSTAPEPGDYGIYIIVESTTGRSRKSEVVRITIKPVATNTNQTTSNTNQSNINQ